jgi:2-polyprenyl-6-methoxyphenol hydroxylase-like FAD-dependent oxidoreductase
MATKTGVDPTDVLVVGAGPVGLMLASELRRHCVGCRIIDRLKTPAGWVKALGVSQRTLEVWDAAGVVTEALDAGMPIERSRVFVNRRQVQDADVAYPGEAPYRYPLSLPQPETERILADHLARLGGEVERGVELRSFREVDDGVEASLAGADGTVETARCRYLVGCDGAHSAVRHGLGLPFEGGRFPAEFLLADVEIAWEIPHPASCLFFETRDGALENLLVCIPYRDRLAPGRPRYRVSTMARPVSALDWEVGSPPAEGESASGPTLEEVRELVRRFVPVPAEVGDLRWSSVFRISHRIVPRYRVGRVFLAAS